MGSTFTDFAVEALALNVVKMKFPDAAIGERCVKGLLLQGQVRRLLVQSLRIYR